jgi:hypothetical protein
MHIDFIGPWKVKVNKQVMTYNALTCIEPVTNLIEICRSMVPKRQTTFALYSKVITYRATLVLRGLSTAMGQNSWDTTSILASQVAVMGMGGC